MKRMEGRSRLMIFLVFSTCISLRSQVDYRISYFPWVYTAESAILDDQLDTALFAYKTAFQSTERAFAIDLVNAAVCAIKVDSTDVAYDMLHRLIRKGVAQAYLDEFIGFSALRGTTRWAAMMDHYDALRRSVQFRDRLIVQLDSISAQDQAFRVAPGGYANYRDTITRIDASNVLFLRDVIRVYGFPNEHILGADRPGIDFPGAIVLHHHCQSLSLDTTGSRYNFEPDFYAAIRHGELDPYRMAQLIQMQGQFAPELGQNTVIQLALRGERTMPFRQRMSPERLDAIERSRALAGLDDQEAYFRKAIFALYDPRSSDFEFPRYTMTEIYDCDEATYNKLLKALEPLTQH